MEKAVIEGDSLSKEFKQGSVCVPVLAQVTLSCLKGRSYAITGVSGAGKSTLLHLLAGLEAPTTGQVRYNGIAISSFDAAAREQWLNRTIGIVFQQPYLIAELTVAQNVAIKSMIQGISYKKIEPWVDQLLRWCGLIDKKEAYPRMLSGGQQQRVALARALCSKPLFLFADEPTSNLDEQTGQALIKLMVQFQQEWDMGLVLCSHDSYVTQAMQTIYQVQHGTLVIERQ